MILYPGETVKTEPPVCVCGHDIFFHDISVSNEEGVDATVGCCHEEGCKCPQFYCTQSWLHDLIQKLKRKINGTGLEG